MPNPGKNESQQDFVSRCIGVVIDDGTAKDQKQAAAICYSMWREAKKGCAPDEEEDKEVLELAVWTTAYINNELPDSAFLYIEEGGEKDETGKTKPRSLRHFPYRDASGKVDLAHVRNAIARIPQSNAPGLSPEKKASLQARARRILADASKSLFERGWDALKNLLGIEAQPEMEEKAANAADYIESRIHQNFTTMADDLFGWGQLTREERIGLSGLIGDALDVFHRGLQENTFDGLRERRPMEDATGDSAVGTAMPMKESKEGAIGGGAPSPFMVWKSGDTWRWLAVFTNRYRDRDDPPEILTDAAHRDFEKALDDGSWPMPELWPWHVPHALGVADRVAYDDRGFQVATGTFKNGDVAERVAGMDHLGVSHGMPVKEIRRDKGDPTLITRYRSREISILPLDNAANPYTGFMALEGKSMAMSKEKEEFLRNVVGEDRWPEVEAMLADKAKDTEGVEFKEAVGTVMNTADPSGTTTTTADVPVTLTSQQEAPIGVTKEADTVTKEEVAEELAQITSTFVAQFQRIVDEIAGLKQTVKAMQDAESERQKELVSLTPAASLHDMVRSRVIGAKETRVKADSPLASAAPAAPRGADGPTPVPLINALMGKT